MDISIYSSKNRISDKIAALVLCALLTLTLFFSVLFLTTEMDHDCSGADCPICACMQQCSENINQLGSGLLEILFSVIIPTFFVITTFRLSFTPALQTLIQKKIRLNN